jgi:hypothetical protein
MMLFKSIALLLVASKVSFAWTFDRGFFFDNVNNDAAEDSEEAPDEDFDMMPPDTNHPQTPRPRRGVPRRWHATSSATSLGSNFFHAAWRR